MTNLEKLIQVLGETFPGTKFVEKEILEDLGHCGWLACGVKGNCNIEECQNEDFWHEDYILYDLKQEPDAKILIGYIVMVDDEGTMMPYSGCIHPDIHHASDEVDQAEYHGWTTSVKSVKFQMISKGGGKNA